jgi:hypothetical protein
MAVLRDGVLSTWCTASVAGQCGGGVAERWRRNRKRDQGTMSLSTLDEETMVMRFEDSNAVAIRHFDRSGCNGLLSIVFSKGGEKINIFSY